MDTKIDALADRYLQMVIEDYPVTATFLGVHSRDGELGEYAAEAFEEKADHKRALLREFERLSLEGATVDDVIDARVLRISLESDLRFHEVLKPHERYPLLYIGTALSGLNQLVLRDFAPIEERARSLLARMRQIPDVLACCERNVRDAPAVFIEIAADRARGGARFLRSTIPGVAEKAPLLTTDLEAAAARAAERFEATAEHLSRLVPDATSPFAVGREFYEWLLREVHLLDLDSEGLRELGERAIGDTKAEMARAASEIDPDRDWHEIIEELKAEHPAEGAVRERYAFEMERARRFVLEHDLVTVPDGERLDVIDTPVFARKLLPYAAYMPAGPFETRQQGFFWVTPVDASLSDEDRERQLRGHGLRAIPVTALHEGYPGHHLQLVRANANPRKARKLAWNTVFIEGWALYCEEMMKDVGFLDDPGSRLFQLKDTLWRAARVVADVGLQSGEMSIDQAVDYMVEEAALERVNAVAEVKRYATAPTQPSSYLVGKLDIMDIRRRYEEERGADFDLKSFHDALLDVGSVPPRLARHALGIGEARSG